VAGNSHAIQRTGKDFSAPVNYEQLISSAREFTDLPRDLLNCFRTFQ